MIVRIGKLAAFYSVIAMYCGCTPKVFYAKFGSFKLDACERNVHPIGPEWLSKFEQFCYHGSDEILLNRVVSCENDSTILFISVSDTKLQNDLQQLISKDSTAQIIQTKSMVMQQQRIDCSLFKKGDGFVVRYAYVEQRSALLVVLDWVFLKIELAQKQYGEAEKNMVSKFNI